MSRQYHRYPSRRGKWKFQSHLHDGIFPDHGINAFKGVLIFRSPHDDLLVNQKSFFAGEPSPRHKSHNGFSESRSLRSGKPPAGEPAHHSGRLFPATTQSSVFLPQPLHKAPQRGVNERLDAIRILQCIKPVINNLYRVVNGLYAVQMWYEIERGGGISSSPAL